LSSSSSIIFFFQDEELEWMDDGTNDGMDGWKGRPPPDRLRILYIKICSRRPYVGLRTIMVDFIIVENVWCCVNMCCTYFMKIHKMTYTMERENLGTFYNIN
jgi:hypothetical protein